MNDSLESPALPTLVLDKTGGVERLQGGQHGLHMGRGPSARAGWRLVGRWRHLVAAGAAGLPGVEFLHRYWV